MNIQAEPIELSRQDYLSNCDPKWCPGCGCFAILRSMTSMFVQAGIPPHKQVIVSGIGCSSRLPYYSSTYGFHSIHGRAPTVAMGAKLANPDLSVWIISGDGDALAIGGNHTMHLLRRNSDVKMMLLNNQIYGLTKGQASPTTPQGLVTKSSPYGAVDKPIRPILLALASGATFVARVQDKDVKHMEEVMLAAQEHKGAVFIEILMNCVTFYDGAYDKVTNKKTRSEHMLQLEHGKPLIYGEERNKGFINTKGQLESVIIGKDGITEDDILLHDVKSRMGGLAAQLALLEFPDNPYPIGIFRQINAPVYGE
ncbi:MAG: 2-oxoacid:ferredoxin oxidoreductase subunit beta, partial [Gammaproteobacteria bacterium]|nr:2-oxoacid:ferredoxin oxidoreductase subunit beta [Gammaproteobacteria bacterium]